MRGNGFRNVLAENMFAAAPDQRHTQWRNTRPKMCWKCQKDKPVSGGYLRIVPGLAKFICKDCMDAKAEADVHKT